MTLDTVVLRGPLITRSEYMALEACVEVASEGPKHIVDKAEAVLARLKTLAELWPND